MAQTIVSFSPWFDDLARSEIEREHPDAEITKEIAPGVLLVEAAGSFTAFARPWLEKLPIYLHHICPMQACTALTGTRSDLATLAELTAARLMPMLRPGMPLSVQPRVLVEEPAYTAKEVRQALADAIARRVELPLQARGEQVLSVVVGGEAGYMGVSLAAQNISPYAGGEVPYPGELPSRAGYKLHEALAAFELGFRPGTRALDLGAAPGGWTKVLTEQGVRVTAVDSAVIDQDVADNPRVRWARMPAEDFLRKADGPYDLITNDIIMDAQDSARLMVGYAEHLRPGAVGVMTLKLRAYHRRRVMDHSFRILRQAYKIIRVRQLYYNRSEVTLFLRRKRSLS